MLKNKEQWKSFSIKELGYKIVNSKAYHKIELKKSFIGIPYISRTNRNNGLEATVCSNCTFKLNPKNTIVFGAENATFFYQPYKYITGNKMYYITHKVLNKEICLFLVQVLNNSIKNCGFGYGQGLTGSRLKTRSIMLPVNSKGEPDYKYMEDYTKYIQQKKLLNYLDYINKMTK